MGSEMCIRDSKHGKPLRALAAVGRGQHGVNIGEPPVGNEALMAVENVFIPDLPGAGGQGACV